VCICPLTFTVYNRIFLSWYRSKNNVNIASFAKSYAIVYFDSKPIMVIDIENVFLYGKAAIAFSVS